VNHYVFTVRCPSRRGIVAAVSGFLSEKGCNITDSAQFDGLGTDRFFMRITFRSETGAELDTLNDAFRDVAEVQVLAHAIHAHIHHRAFLGSNKTVVFPASLGSYASERLG